MAALSLLRRVRLSGAGAAAAAAGAAAGAGCICRQARAEPAAAAAPPGSEVSRETSAMGELRSILRARADWDRLGWRRLVDVYGSAEQVLLCYLRASAVPWDASGAAERIVKTLSFRAHHNLDRPDLARAIEEHPARSTWPFVMANSAPDGCPVIYARLAHMDVARTVNAYGEHEITRFVAMWFEQALRMQGDTTRATGAPPRGTYDVYDCAGVRSWYKVIYDVKDNRGMLGRVFSVGSEHYPDQLYRCFILNAPSVAMVAWRIISSFLSERVLHRVQISGGVPPELAEALGGDEAVRRMQGLAMPGEPTWSAAAAGGDEKSSAGETQAGSGTRGVVPEV